MRHLFKFDFYKPNLKTFFWLMVDTSIIVFTYFLFVVFSYLLSLFYSLNGLGLVLIIALSIQLLTYYTLGLYRIIVRYASLEDMVRITTLVLSVNVVVLIVLKGLNMMPLTTPVFALVALAQWILMAGSRAFYRVLRVFQLLFLTKTQRFTKTLIIGAGAGGEMVIKELKKGALIKSKPVVIVDDDPAKHHRTLLGVKVIGDTECLECMVNDYQIDEVIIAIANLPYKKLRQWLNVLTQLDVTIRRLPLLREMNGNDPLKLKDVKVEDLLNRDTVNLDTSALSQFIQNKSVLVTGGGGSIGSELCRQIASYEPKELIIFDIYENNAYDIQMELLRTFPALKTHVYIGSVYNPSRLEKVFKVHCPALVYHAAAYKHVPLMEVSPMEALRTNILGTYHAASLASQYACEHFVLVSSDKAVRPTNVMGATKRMAELIIKQVQEQSQTIYSAVRFGNVLNSNGSVIPLFKKQLESGGPLTVTHPDITRYFMTIPEAVSLILQAGVFAKQGDIFVLDMGEAVKIKDLAEKMVRLSGLKPHDDIEIRYIGLRPGEKLFEEILIDEDHNVIKTANEKIYIEQNHTAERLVSEVWLHELATLDTLEHLDIKPWLKGYVPSFEPKEDT